MNLIIEETKEAEKGAIQPFAIVKLVIKIVFFDFDGVLTVTGHACSEICNYLEPVAKLPADKIEPAFHRAAKQLLVNGKRYRDHIDGLNNELGTNLTADDILNAVQKSKLNLEMEDILRDLKTKGIRVGILTDNNIERLEMIRKHPLFGSLSPIVGSSEVGCTKDKCEAIFTKALKEANLSPKESLFIDNKKECLEIPKGMGFHVYLHDEHKNDVAALRKHLKEQGLL